MTNTLLFVTNTLLNSCEVVDFQEYLRQNGKIKPKGVDKFPVFVIMNKETREPIAVKSTEEKAIEHILSLTGTGVKYVWKEFILDE